MSTLIVQRNIKLIKTPGFVRSFFKKRARKGSFFNVKSRVNMRATRGFEKAPFACVTVY